MNYIDTHVMQTTFMFTQKNQGISKIQLNEISNRLILIYFYPKDNTPGCTLQAQNFSQHYMDLINKDIMIIGVSKDTLKAHDNFIAKFDLPFALIADTEEVLCDAFGVLKLKNMFGKQVRGIERSTFILTPKGEILKEWRKVNATENINQVIDYLNIIS